MAKTLHINFGKYKLIIFVMAQLMKMETTEQNKVALYCTKAGANNGLINLSFYDINIMNKGSEIMKKKVLIVIALIAVLGIVLFVLTGCGKNTNNNENNSSEKNRAETEDNTVVTIGDESFKLKSETELNHIHYLENYVDFHTDRVGNTKTMSYTKNGSLAFEVRVNYDENRSDSEVKAIISTQYNATEKAKEVNGIKYIYYEYTTDTGENVHHYIYVYNGKVYSIGFFLGENSGNIEEVFMNNVSFE